MPAVGWAVFVSHSLSQVHTRYVVRTLHEQLAPLVCRPSSDLGIVLPTGGGNLCATMWEPLHADTRRRTDMCGHPLTMDLLQCYQTVLVYVANEVECQVCDVHGTCICATAPRAGHLKRVY